MIQPLTNNEVIFLKYLENVCDLPDYIVAQTEAVLLNGFIGNNQNRFIQTPIEILICGCLEYVCDRNSFDLNYDELANFVNFMFPKQLCSNMDRVHKVKSQAFARFEGKDIRLIQLRCPYNKKIGSELFDFD